MLSLAYTIDNPAGAGARSAGPLTGVGCRTHHYQDFIPLMPGFSKI